MSIINLLADDVWSDADITRRTESMVRAEFSAEAETILNRKVSGALLGAYVMTPADGAEVERFNAVTMAAALAGAQARADMALLAEALAIEAAQRRLALEPVPDDATDAAEREQAQAVVAAATEAAQQLVAQRAAARSQAEPEPQEVTE